jgi:hypothetical protein
VVGQVNPVAAVSASEGTLIEAANLQLHDGDLNRGKPAL